MTALQLPEPREFIQYVIAAVEANPDLREPLLRALLTEEFLQMPVRVARIEKDVGTLTERFGTLTEDVDKLKDDVGWLRGKAHETDFSRTATSLLNREFGFRRTRVVHGNVVAVPRYAEEFADSIAGAAEDGTISDEQLQRIFATDVIVQCRHPQSSELVWVAVEVSGRVDEDDINRAVQSAQILRAVFGQEALSVVVGERIDSHDAARAQQSGAVFIPLAE
ncbi:MAG: hypothetical protein F4X66_01880 [Chloroflexi bacterium]|nr:hypothetical protein [Chloroflexota bacterium]MYE40393.1 hypothetical protein [Chloroflexota bacterium]